MLMNGFSRVLDVFKTLFSSSSDVSGANYSGEPETKHQYSITGYNKMILKYYSGSPTDFSLTRKTSRMTIEEVLTRKTSRMTIEEVLTRKTSRMTHYGFASKYKTGEIAENGVDRVISRGEKNFSVHKGYMNFLRPRKIALDAPLYAISGRSMIEMLGVLAIIGVLSVGGIAGYSKAMQKYKMNQTIELANEFINGMAIHLAKNSEFDRDHPYFKPKELEDMGIISAGLCEDENAQFCQTPIGRMSFIIRHFNGGLRVDLSVDFEGQNIVKNCTEFSSYHWEKVLPEYIDRIRIDGLMERKIWEKGRSDAANDYSLARVQKACTDTCVEGYCSILITFVNKGTTVVII